MDNNSENMLSRLQNDARQLIKTQSLLQGAIEDRRAALRNEEQKRLTTVKHDAEKRLKIAQIRIQDKAISAHADALSAAKMALALDGPEVLRVCNHATLGTIDFDGRPAGINEPLKIPLIIPLLCSENVAVYGNNDDSDAVVRNIVLQALTGTAPGQLRIDSYDPFLKTPEAVFSFLNDHIENTIANMQSDKELDNLLDELTEDVTRISAMMRGADIDLREFRADAGMPVERYRLIVMHEYPQKVSEDQHSRIMTLARRGAQYGITFLFDMGDMTAIPDWFDTSKFSSVCQGIRIGKGHDQWDAMGKSPVSFDRADLKTTKTRMDDMAEKAATVQIPKVPFSEIQPDGGWVASSADGVTFALGRKGPETYEITLGNNKQQLHNALITGAVGQGKSNLLKVIIYSLCSRYSPDELSLYLLDFKEGVTLYPMAPTPGSPQFLPQARILGLEADQDFGVSVLEYLEQEFQRRARLFKPYGDNILKYRQANPDAVMPRIVLIVDEFHMMLENVGDSRAGSEAADLLERIVRRGRSYGVHVILASQSISGISTLVASGQGVFAQFPIRIGLKNSPQEAISTFSQRNDASAHLRYRGQAIVNKNFGLPDANETVMVAAADDDDLERLRDEFYERSGNTTTPPMVFDGSRTAELAPDLKCLKPSSAVPLALVGHPVKVGDEAMTMRMSDSSGRGIAILGSGVAPNALPEDTDNNMAIGSVEAVGISLAMQAVGKNAMRFVILDFLNETDRMANHVRPWIEAMKRSGQDIETIDRREFFDWLKDMVDSIPKRQDGDQPTYILGLGVERVGKFERDQEKMFQNLLIQGSIADIHVIAWWSNTTIFQKQMGAARANAFDASLLFYGAEDMAKAIHGSVTRWKGQENRGLYFDNEAMTTPLKIIPYMPVSERGLETLWAERTDYGTR